MKIKNILVFGTLLLILLHVGIVLGSGEMTSGELYYGDSPGVEIAGDGTILCTGDADKLIFNKGENYETTLECSRGIEISPLGKISIVEKGANFTINGVDFSNIASGEILLSGGKISKADFYTTKEEGGFYDFDGNKFKVNADSHFVYPSKKGGFLLPDGTEVLEVQKNIQIESLEGELFKYKGNDFSGTVNFDEKGSIFVRGKDIATINGVEVDTGKHTNEYKVNLFFDGQEHEGTYVSFGEKTIRSSKGDASFYPLLNFKENNSYIKIEKGDHVFLWGDSFLLENRDSEGFIPKITLLEKDTFLLDNDGKRMSIFKGKIAIESTSIGLEPQETTSSPLEIEIKNLEGNKKMFFDNFNRFAIASSDSDTDYIAKSEGIDVKFSSRIKYNYIDEGNLEKLVGVPIEFQEGEEVAGSKSYWIEEGKKQMVLGRLRDYYEGLTPETKESIGKIEFVSSEYFESDEGYQEDKNVLAFASPDDNKLVFRSDPPFFENYVFRHESAHLRDFDLEKNSIGQKSDKKKKEMELLLDKLLSSNSSQEEAYYQKKYLKAKADYLEKYNKLNRFDSEWGKISSKAGNYLSLVGKKEVEKYGTTFFYRDSPNDNSPKYGFLRPYGGENQGEDIATYLEKINNPEFFKPLLSEDNRWHEIYRGKLHLLYEYKFISESEYNKILEVAGVK